MDGYGFFCSSIPFPPLTGFVPYTGATTNLNMGVFSVTANSFIKTGGTSSQFLKADGSVDSNSYIILSSLSASSPLSYNNLTGAFSISQASSLSNGYLSSTDWSTFNGKQNTISLTTVGSSGAATFIANTLNIPNYTLAGLGGTTLAAVNAQNLSVFAATTSAQLAGVISDETGSGALVFGTSPTFITNITTPQITGVSGNLTLTNAIQSSGAITQFSFTNVANTNQTATSNIPNFRINGANKQWATGTVANQYWNYLTANTVAFVGASTLSESVALQIEAATAGTNATITNNFALGLLAGTATVKIGNFTGSTTNAAVYMNQAIPSSANYTIRSDTAGNTFVNGSQIFLCVGGTSQLVMNNNSFSFQSLVAATTGAVTSYTFNSPNHSGQTASTEIVGQSFNTYTRTWLQGNITNQREMYLRSVNYAFSNTSTITNAYRLYIEAAANGGNATITNNYALGLAGSLSLATVGSKIAIKEGSGGFMGQVALVAGTKVITVAGVTTSSRAFVQLVTPNTTTLTVNYQVVCTANTVTITALVAAGTINVADLSTLNYIIVEGI